MHFLLKQSLFKEDIRSFSGVFLSSVWPPWALRQYGLILPVMMVSHSDGPRLLQIGARVTFPVISRKVKPQGQAPYSRHGPLSSGRLKPDVVLPGDGITSTSVGAACSFKQMSLSAKTCQIFAGILGWAFFFVLRITGNAGWVT